MGQMLLKILFALSVEWHSGQVTNLNPTQQTTVKVEVQAEAGQEVQPTHLLINISVLIRL